MKSGIRSMGLSAYAATAAARSVAYHGTRGSRAAIQTATTSCLIARAHCFARFSTDRFSKRRVSQVPDSSGPRIHDAPDTPPADGPSRPVASSQSNIPLEDDEDQDDVEYRHNRREQRRA